MGGKKVQNMKVKIECFSGLRLIYSALEIDLDFPLIDMLLRQVFGISDFFTNVILMSIVYNAIQL